jgi:hypothetical protein
MKVVAELGKVEGVIVALFPLKRLILTKFGRL